jgi:DNA-binding NarL/FixJ family response regulator
MKHGQERSDAPTDLTDEGLAKAIRVLVVDDHPLFREGVVSLLERVRDVELVGEAGTGEEAIRLAVELSPEVILMDLQMPGIGGIEATREIVNGHPETGVIVLTMFEDEESAVAALFAGASGYVLKDGDRGSLLRAIRAVAEGEVLFAAPVWLRAMNEFRKGGRPPQEQVVPPIDKDRMVEELTNRELEVLRLIAQGLHNREIAAQLVISEKTVGNHISSIFAKLQVKNRFQAMRRAQHCGLLTPAS